MEFTDFFFHEHPLMLTEDIKEWITCSACHEYLSRQAYTCRECYFTIHKSCAELPQVFQNPYHPHPLTLVTEKQSFKCIACLRDQFAFHFHCGKCDFDLDIKCAFWVTNEVQDQLHHLTHFHPLVFIEKKQENGDDLSCKVCREPSSDALYGCDPCNFYLHRSCAKFPLPPTLQHFHHSCLLTLCLDKEGSDCKACGSFYKFYSYLCEPCNFKMEIRCAQFPDIMESLGQKQIHHFSHGHPLKLKEIKHDDKIPCSACQKCCSGQTYVCCSSRCRFFLHDSCFHLPQNIRHPLHPHHFLTLYSQIQRQSIPKCKFCCRLCFGFTYSCNHCIFHMHVECPVMIYPLKYQGHHHNIFFIDDLDPFQIHPDDDAPCYKQDNDDPSRLSCSIAMCSACGSSCTYATAMFHCIECDFDLHFKCGPLPYFVKHEDHPCSLKITDSPVMHDGGDRGRDVFVCDVCEEERDPRLPVYYCSNGCAYIAEIKCMMSEVLISLRGECGEVELRSTIFKHKAGKVISKSMVEGIELPSQDGIADRNIEFGKLEANPSLTLEEIFNEQEMKEMWIGYSWASNYGQDPDDLGTDKRAFSCSDEDYTKFMEKMDSNNETAILLDIMDTANLNKQVINFGDHRVSFDLAPILEDLCTKYGDIILESGLQTSGARTIFIGSLCETVRGMCTTRVADMSQAQLFNWWNCLKTLQFLGFKVEFAIDRLKRVSHAYYALQVQETVSNDLQEMDREIVIVSQGIDQLEAKVVAQKADLAALKERRKISEPLEPASSSILAKCYKEASELRWMIAGEGFL